LGHQQAAAFSAALTVDDSSNATGAIVKRKQVRFVQNSSMKLERVEHNPRRFSLCFDTHDDFH